MPRHQVSGHGLFASTATATHHHEYTVVAEPVGDDELRGWLLRSGGPYNTPSATDSLPLTLVRFAP